ncbi:MAG: serine/threonine-protein phosphatase [Burkholderiales bacterium]|nr:serine/threonine-protein phosphatase [Burkholderiales bacterium]
MIEAVERSDCLPLWAASGQVPLRLRVGCATGAAPGKANEDYYGVARMQEMPERGVVLALADGISPDAGARAASEMVVRSLLHDFYAVPAGWSASRALDRLLEATNDWLTSENRRRPALAGVVVALSVLVLRDDSYSLAHVGDTRVYRHRGRHLRQLTVDHTWPRRDMRHVLKRAVGLDTYLVADFAEGELRAGDTFLMVSDGVWDVLGDKAQQSILEGSADPHGAAQQLVADALKHQAGYMGRNDATAVVAMVETAR